MKLGKLLSAYMAQEGLTLRALAAQVGTDHSTLHRLIHGLPCRMDTLTKILAWLSKP